MHRIESFEKIVITGGLGFIGQNLIRALLARGVSPNAIFVVDSLVNCSGEAPDPSINIEERDFRDLGGLATFYKQADLVFHLAAQTRVQDSIEAPQENFDLNVLGTFQLLEAFRGTLLKKFVFASTGGAILGDSPPPIDEAMTPYPKSPYGASKACIENYLSAFYHSYKVPYLALRFSNIFGKYSNKKKSAVSAFIRQIESESSITIFGDGRQTRDFLYVDDLVAGVIQSAISSSSGVFQLGSGIGTSIIDLAEMILKNYDREVRVLYQPALPGEVLHTFCNISKACAAFDFKPRTSLQDGIRSTVEWHANKC